VLKTSKHRHSAAGVIQRRSGALARIHGFHIAKSFDQKLRKTVILGELLADCLRNVLIGMQSSAALRSITAFSLGRYLSMGMPRQVMARFQYAPVMSCAVWPLIGLVRAIAARGAKLQQLEFVCSGTVYSVVCSECKYVFAGSTCLTASKLV
jgi:hypothetical protein